MPIRFSAATGGVESSEAEGWCAVGLAEEADGSGRALVFQAMLTEPQEQDRAAGLDTYCVSSESGASTYAGVDAIEATRDRLHVVLTARAAEELGLADRELEIDLGALPPDTVTAAHEGLRAILAHGRPDAYPSRVSIS